MEEATPLVHGVARDTSDKLNGTYAVVFKGDMIPMRFSSKREAFIHLQALEGVARHV